MDIEEIRRKKAAGEKLTAGEEFFLKKNESATPDSAPPISSAEASENSAPQKKEKGPIVLKDRPNKEEKKKLKKLDKASRQAQGNKRKKFKKEEKTRGKEKSPPFYKNILSEYRGVWSVLFGLMAAALIVGFVLPNDTKIMLLTEIFGKFTDILEGVQTKLQLALAIFLNNLEVSALLFALGITVIAPVLMVIGNGLMIGIFFDFIVRLEALEPGILLSSMVGVFPHGIIEIPAFVLTASLGIALLIKLVAPNKFIPGKSRSRVLLDMVLRYALILLPLFLLAAFVEAYVSPLLSSKVDDLFSARFQDEELAQYGPDKVVLAEMNCTPAGTGNIVPESMLSSSSAEQIKVIFNERIFRQIESYREIPKHTESYVCGGSGLQIRMLEMNYPDFIDYVALQREIFRELGHDTEEAADGLIKVSRDDSHYYFGYTQKSDFVFMVVTYFGEDEGLARSVLES